MYFKLFFINHQMVHQHALATAVAQQGYINSVSPVGPLQLGPMSPVSNGLPSPTITANAGNILIYM